MKFLLRIFYGVLALVCGFFLLVQAAGRSGSSPIPPVIMDLHQLSGELELYKLDNGNYPDQLTALITKPSKAENWHGPYCQDKLLVDPWGHEYRYSFPGKRNIGRFDLWSAGPDGKDGTEDDVYRR